MECSMFENWPNTKEALVFTHLSKAMRQLSKRNEKERKGRGVRQLTGSRKRPSLFIG